MFMVFSSGTIHHTVGIITTQATLAAWVVRQTRTGTSFAVSATLQMLFARVYSTLAEQRSVLRLADHYA